VRDNVAPVAANLAAGERLAAFGSVIGPAKLDGRGGHTQPTDLSCDAQAATSLGYNVVADASCGLTDATDLICPDGSGVDRVPVDRCGLAPMPPALPGEQHLQGLIGDWRALLATDQRGVPRPQGIGCDSGAVEQ
jgi:hypothetical protein